MTMNSSITQDVFPALIVVTTAEFPTPVEELSFHPPTKGNNTFQINTARIIVTPDRVLIARDSAEGPVPIFSEAIEPGSHFKNPNRAGTSYVTTLSGKKIAFEKDTSCGCGSRLKTWRPFKFVASSQDPS